MAITFLASLVASLFVCAFTQYSGYPSYPYNYGGYRPYPVSNYPYGYYPSVSSPCQSPCGNIQRSSYCQYLPCYRQQQYYTPYISPYPYYGSRNYLNPYMKYYGVQKGLSDPYVNYYGGHKKLSDPYANVPVEIIDDDSVLGHKVISPSNKKDEYADVPVEIIDDDTSFERFLKNVPRLPKNRSPESQTNKINRSPQNNYTVSHGEISSNSIVQNKPISATITRSFEPLKKSPEVRIDFLNGAPIAGNEAVLNTDENDEKSEQTTIEDKEDTTTIKPETNEVTENEDEEVPPVKSWNIFN